MITTHADRLQFSGRRVACPVCGSGRGFAPSVDHPSAGYCHSCRRRIDPRAAVTTDRPIYTPPQRDRAHPPREAVPPDVGPWIHVATWGYTEETGAPLYCVDRYERYDREGTRYDKAFRQRPADHLRYQRSDRDSSPVGASIDGIRRVLWDLPELGWAMRHGGRVYICEGEKAAQRLTDYLRYEHGGPDRATTAAGGAAGWGPAYAPGYADTLRGARVAVWPDADDAGVRWSRDVVAALRGVAARVDIVGGAL